MNYDYPVIITVHLLLPVHRLRFDIGYRDNWLLQDTSYLYSSIYAR